MKLSKKMLAIGTLATLPILPIAFSSCTNLSSENDLLRAKVSELNSTIENTKTKLDSLENENKQLDYKNKAQDVDAKVDMFKLRGEYAAYIGFINDNVVTKYDLLFKGNTAVKNYWDSTKNVLLSWRLVNKTDAKDKINIYTPSWGINEKKSLVRYSKESIQSKTIDDINKDKALLAILLKKDKSKENSEDTNAEKKTLLDKYDIEKVSAITVNLTEIFTKNYLENDFISKNTKEDLFKTLYIANDDLGLLLTKFINKDNKKSKP
ncbi:hypothetical protein LNO75_01445 [Mycoplasma sp. T363T]|uniref:hypothetical protein n=1 Tax=Mycoplasma bradburyae TaxID=2963128 RepID=UPI0023403EDB|nr:hypothetical protein [Mycoplasma bradburyae]MDC4163243.1 hypothetical protein [Mycoplasma bradburyae]